MQQFLLMISNEEKDFLAVKKLSALLREVTSKFMVIFIVFFFRNRKEKLESHKKVYKNKDFCIAIMPSEDTKTLEFNQYQNSDKVPFIIYAGLKCNNRKD